MPVPYPAEVREHAVRLALEARKNPATRDGAITRVAKQLDLLPETRSPENGRRLRFIGRSKASRTRRTYPV